MIIMYKKSPSRNQRPKGVKIKHVLQICLLLGVCFWLVYQVKHSHDKRKEFDEKDVKVSAITLNDDVIPKLGRKDLPRLGEESNSEKHEDEDEDDGGVEEEIKHGEEQKQEPNKHVEEDQEEENSHGDDGQDEDDNKNEEMEEEVRAGGDDEVDEQEKLAGETNHMEELVADDEKEREGEDDEKEQEENIGQVKEAGEGNGIQEVGREEIENSVDEENHDVEDGKGHEAREGHYKGDDASSAVSHEPQITDSDVEKSVKENFNILEEEKRANGTEASNSENYSSAALKVEEKQSPVGTLLNVTASKFGNESLPNLTKEAELNHQSNNNSTELIAETTSGQLQNGTSLVLVQAQNTTRTSEATGAEFNHLVVASNDSSVSRTNQTDVDPMVINKAGHQDLPAGMDNSSQLSDMENKESKTYEEGDNPLENIASSKQDGSSGTSDSNTSGDESQNDPIDSSDLTLPQEERDARVDLGTLPDMKSEVGNNEDAAAE